MASEVIIDGEVYLDNRIDGECGVILRAGEELPSNEPYGVWTDIVGRYLGRDMETGRGLFTRLADLDENGNVIPGARAVCESYLPYMGGRKYVKSDHRITNLCCYNENKNLIFQDTSSRYDNTYWGIELDVPVETAYIRFAINVADTHWRIQIYRVE